MRVHTLEEIEDNALPLGESQPLETKSSCIDDLLKEKLEKAVHEQTFNAFLHDIAQIAADHSPIDLAYAASYLPPNICPLLYENLPDQEAKIKFIIHTDNDTRLALFRILDDLELQQLFEKVPTDEAVWLIEDMPERRFRRLMELIDPQKAARIKELKTHDRKSAVRLMTSDFFAFTMDKSIGDATAHIRDNPRIDFTNGVFVLNELGELQGYVPARNMMIHAPHVPLSQIMRPILQKVAAEATREEVIHLVERYKISSLPVVDIDDRLIGVIAYADIVEAMEDLTDETIAHIAGTHEKFAAHDSVCKRFVTRAPWLLVTLAAGLLNVAIMSSFQEHGGVLTFAICFVPLITGMSGNVGLQCSTVLIRAMAMGGLSLGARKETITKELLSGIFTGAIFGVSCGVIVYLFNSWIGSESVLNAPLAVATVVSVGLIGSCVAGTLLGVFSPLFFCRIGVDPAIAAGPIVTAFNDFLSMTIYFLIAWGVSMFFF